MSSSCPVLFMNRYTTGPSWCWVTCCNPGSCYYCCCSIAEDSSATSSSWSMIVS